MPVKIRKLAESTINLISAGEVIEKPSSVVKELVENSIDAGASQIEIWLEQGGKNLIVVKDNGCGMSEENLLLSVEHYTTSKLNEQDLMDIHTFGFRGEALPSIATISNLNITSCAKSSRAYQLTITGGKAKNITPTVHQVGTKVEVRDLFFATPARLKFLKANKTEAYSCLEIIKKLAIANSHVDFSCYVDGRLTLKFKPTKLSDEIEAIKPRINDIIGSDFSENSLSVDLQDDYAKIRGLISLPTFNRNTTEDQFLFVNNRPIKDKIFSAAIRVAYKDFIPKDRHPVLALFVSLEPYLVDVNVHPTKSEVRFRDPYIIRDLVITALRRALNSFKHLNTGNYVTTQNYSLEQVSQDNNAQAKPYHLGEKNNNFIPTNLLDQPTTSSIENSPRLNVDNLFTSHPQVLTNNGILSSEVFTYPLGAACSQFNHTFIISQTKDSIIIVDQHAAHERLVYEQIKLELSKGNLESQTLLLPVTIKVPDLQRLSLLEEHSNILENSGLTFVFNPDLSVTVTSIPLILTNIDLEQLIKDLIDDLLELRGQFSLTTAIEHIAKTFACHNSIRAGKKLNITEMNELLRQIEKTPNSGQCNHGRPTYIKLKLSDINKLFGR